MENKKSGLFGLEYTNRDFTKHDSWGKNQFNSSFPASLGCYMHSKNIEPVYITLTDQLKPAHGKIAVKDLFGAIPNTPDLFFSFETQYTPFASYMKGDFPRADLVTIDTSKDPHQPCRALEIKLTALPDTTTYKLSDDKYGSEIVVRPDTIVYLAIGIADAYQNDRNELKRILNPVNQKVSNWEDAAEVVEILDEIETSINEVLLAKIENQFPFLMQPIWKTVGKSGGLAEQCFDMFVWSDFGFTRLFTKAAEKQKSKRVGRIERSVVWLFKMLCDYMETGSINAEHITDRLTYNTNNDKAFSVSGTITNRFMACAELTSPRIKREAVREIILNGGQNFLSPERRLDAAILNTPGLFDDEELKK